MKITTILYRDPAPVDTPAALPPTLEELFNPDAPNIPAPVVIVPPPIVPGNGEPKPGDLEAATQLAAQEAEDKLAADQLAAEVAAAAAEDDEPDTRTPEQIAEDEAAAEAASPDAFFAAVDALTGESVNVEYPADVDPISPEGVALRDAVIRMDEVNKWVEHLKAQDPRGYAYMLHRQAGGDDVSFFEAKTLSLPDQAAFEASVELQSQVYKNSLTTKGVDEDVADAMLAKAIKENTLKAKADGAYNSIRTSQEQQLADMEADSAADLEEFNNMCAVVTTSLSKAVDEGGLKFIVPDARKAGFKEFVNNSLRHEGGKFYSVLEIGDDSKNVLEALYFKYIKGDLASLVEKRAGTKAVQGLKLRVNKALGAAPKAGSGAKPATGYVPLSDI